MTMTRGAAGYARGAGAYARVGVESGVMSASPHQLISMLFDGAGTAIRAAALHMREGQVAEKGKAISKALDIVNNGLLAALDREKGGELAARLLLNANLRNDPASLDEAGRLLADLGEAWNQIKPAAHQGAE